MKELTSNMEAKETVKELKKQEVPQLGFKQGEVNGMSKAEVDALANKRLESQRAISDVSFTGTPESAKRYLDMAERHMQASRSYEREANRIEREIALGRIPKSKSSEVQRLRRKAESEKAEAERLKRMARYELNK